MGRLIPFDSSSSAVVTETDIWNIVSLQEKLASTQARIDRVAHSVLERLGAGAEIEEGCHYAASLEAVEVSGIREERLIIDGVCRWRRIAGSSAALRRHTAVLATEPL